MDAKFGDELVKLAKGDTDAIGKARLATAHINMALDAMLETLNNVPFGEVRPVWTKVQAIKRLINDNEDMAALSIEEFGGEDGSGIAVMISFGLGSIIFDFPGIED